MLAYLINFFMSWLFFVEFMNRPLDGDTKRAPPFDKWIAVFKLMGTAFVLPIIFMLYPQLLRMGDLWSNTWFMVGLGVGCAVLDTLYLRVILRCEAERAK